MQRADTAIGGALLAYVMIRWPHDQTFPSQQIVSAAARTQQALRQAPGFAADFSILNILAATPGRSIADRYQRFSRIRKSLRSNLINPAEQTLLVTPRVRNDGAAALGGRLEHLEQLLQEIRTEFPDFSVTVTGTVVAASKNMNAIILDLARSLAIAAVLIFAIFTIAFRSLRLGLLSVVPNTLPLLVTAAGLTLFGLPLQITSALTFSLCLGLAVDDTMHVLIRFRTANKYANNRQSAVTATIQHVGPALVITTLILLAGFTAMLASPLPGVRLFAALSALTLVTALIGDLMIFPAMLVCVVADNKRK